MQDRFENYILAQQLLNLTNKLAARSGLREKLAEWFCEEGASLLGIKIPQFNEGIDRPSPYLRLLSKFGDNHWNDNKNRISPATWQELVTVLQSRVKTLRTSKKSPLQKNIDVLSKEVGFDITDRAIFGMAVRIDCYDTYKNLCDGLYQNKKIAIPRLVSALLKISPSMIAPRLKPSSVLAKTGLLKLQTSAWSSDFSDFMEVPKPILQAVQPPNEGIADMEKAIFGSPCTVDLEWSDFDHLKEQRSFIANLIAGAVREKAKGINILLYGAPGTGKTEFCKTLAAHLDLKLYSVGELDEDGEEPDRKSRIASLRFSDLLLARHKSTVLLFDEMEDLIENDMGLFFSSSKSSSKVFTNRLLENNSVPTVWTRNDIGSFDPAMLRRMSLVIEFKPPPPPVRERIWKKAAKKNRLAISQSQILQLSQTITCPPSIISNALRTAKLAKGGEKEIRLSVKNMARVAGQNVKILPLKSKEIPFDAALINADQDLIRLTKQLAKKDAIKNFSFCLYGPPGNGKSAYVRFLAQKLDMEVIQKRTSDLVSKWVGQTEQNIAAAFDEAIDREAFLIFDEADSLLADRQNAKRSWEVNQVNEMLTWMESHPLPFACTSNLMKNLDPASLRRFTFKVNCQYLSPDQAKNAFNHFFQLPAPASVERLSNLTPGDFAVIRKQAAITGQLSDANALLKLLQSESAIKPHMPSPIGFGAHI